ncbi:unnamed protein product [Prorocentrum cordatum]|uniref:Uncharacterized protein n=1 Tax=Prorocentrum cordatum TaxID=2364126 RepID=A0ABN9R7V3_9DINO|nr:unnamed protein product [Polarella glacialis]
MTSVTTFHTSNAATHELNLRIGLAFGKSHEQDKIIAKLEQQYVPGSVWKFTQLKAAKRNDQYHSAPHTCTFNLLHKKMKAEPIHQPNAVHLPTEVEPSMASGDVLALSRPQALDVRGRITKLNKDLPQKNRLLTEVHISDLAGDVLQINVWDTDRELLPTLIVTDVVYVFGGWLTKESGGGVHLSANASTVIRKASGSLPGAKALLTLDMSTVETKALTTGAPAADYAKGPAVSMNISALEFVTSFQTALPETLFEVPSCALTLADANPERLCAHGMERVYARVSVSDASGSLGAYLPEATALVLSESEDKGAFLSADSADSSVGPKTPSLVIVSGETRQYDHADPLPRAPSEDGLLPATLPWLAQSPTGRLTITSSLAPAPVLATGALVLARGAQQPQVDSIAGGFAIKNMITDVIGTDQDTKWTATTTSVVARLPQYSIARKHVALVHVAHVDTNSRTLVLSDVWHMQDAASYPEWEKELAAAWDTVKQPAVELKRKRDDNDSFQNAVTAFLSPERKRVAHFLGGVPHAA